MEGALVEMLPNLGVGVASVVAIYFVVSMFLKALKDMRDSHEKAISERETAFRALEKEIRSQLTTQLTQNTQVMERVMLHLDTH